ncbi:hypothetical protein GGI13_003473 [Coemansia sp. RSA 455]|nr:hypothetical protein GGI13_003473 [Coemansia sp. RSA 455]
MSQKGPNKRPRCASPEPFAQHQAAPDNGIRGVRLPLDSRAVADASEHQDDVLPEQPHTPDRPMPPWIQKGATRSPSSVTGQMLRVGGDFGHIARKNGLIVDRTLICKALIDCDVEVICVCLPRRFEEFLNDRKVERLFNVVTSNDVKPVDGTVDLEAGRTERLKLFEESLLHTTERELFDEHFCRYPVIRINFKLLYDVYKSQYVVLFDEYDKPLKTIRGQP